MLSRLKTLLKHYRISSNKHRGVCFNQLMARKAFIRGRRLLEGGVYFFVQQG